jgi:hypothetical protein
MFDVPTFCHIELSDMTMLVSEVASLVIDPLTKELSMLSSVTAEPVACKSLSE